MKKFIAVAAVLLLACAIASAQFHISLGYARAWDLKVIDTSLNSSGVIADSERYNGFSAGAGYSFKLADGLFLTPGVNYLLIRGRRTVIPEERVKTEHFINVPLHLSYDIAFAPGVKFFVFAGPTASMLFSTGNPEFHRQKSFDILAGGGAGLKFVDKFCLRAGYDYGLFNSSNYNFFTLHRSRLNISLAYLF